MRVSLVAQLWANSVGAVRLRALPLFLVQQGCLRFGVSRCGPAAAVWWGGDVRCFVGVNLSSIVWVDMGGGGVLWGISAAVLLCGGLWPLQDIVSHRGLYCTIIFFANTSFIVQYIAQYNQSQSLSGIKKPHR